MITDYTAYFDQFYDYVLETISNSKKTGVKAKHKIPMDLLTKGQQLRFVRNHGEEIFNTWVSNSGNLFEFSDYISYFCEVVHLIYSKLGELK